MKFGKSTLFFIILAVALLTTLGMNIKEGLTPNYETGTRQKYQQIANQRQSVPNVSLVSISSIESDDNKYDKFWSERRGVRRVDIDDSDKDLYVLKSSIVPPVCPKCPQSSVCPRQKPCPACPACARCPEPAFTCKKVPNYGSMNNQYLPLPWLSQSSS